MSIPDPMRHMDGDGRFNGPTAAVDKWLLSERNKPALLRIVEEWNANNLLGVDLSDALLKYMIDRLSKLSLNSEEITSLLSDVAWNELAEYYALHLANVDEEELIARRSREMKQMLR